MTDYLKIADDIIAGKILSEDACYQLAQIPEANVLEILDGAEKIRQHFFSNAAHLCAICNAKSGKCSENCAFCAQSAHYDCQVDVYPIKSEPELRAGALSAAQNKINRYSLVTSGCGLANAEIQQSVNALKDLDKIDLCCSYGIIDDQGFRILKESGVTRYHHNLETAPSHFDKICTTHKIEERIATIKLAQKHGLQVCSGGIFGIGESDQQVVELALVLRDLDVDAVPINFLVAVPGTPLENMPIITPQRALKIIAIMRYIMPTKDVLLCGGRQTALKEDQNLIFKAGASGIMTGDYLTTSGQIVAEDKKLLDQTGMNARH